MNRLCQQGKAKTDFKKRLRDGYHPINVESSNYAKQPTRNGWSKTQVIQTSNGELNGR